LFLGMVIFILQLYLITGLCFSRPLSPDLSGDRSSPQRSRRYSFWPDFLRGKIRPNNQPLLGHFSNFDDSINEQVD